MNESVLVSPWPRRRSKDLELLRLFDEFQSAGVLPTNDLWAEEGEGEGSPRGGLEKAEGGERDEVDR